MLPMHTAVNTYLHPMHIILAHIESSCHIRGMKKPRTLATAPGLGLVEYVLGDANQ